MPKAKKRSGAGMVPGVVWKIGKGKKAHRTTAMMRAGRTKLFKKGKSK